MFPFKQNLSSRQKNASNWVNTCEYIILHHTGTWYNTLNGNIKVLLGETSRIVSAHMLVDTNGDAYKLWDPKQILWHAGTSEWKWKKGMNSYSIGIEVIWPLPWFTDEQKKTVFWLVQHLMAVFKIPKENVLRHASIAPWRKTDIDLSFFPENNFSKWKDTLKPREWN